MPRSHNQLPCYVETVPGIEEIAWLEIRAQLPADEFGELLFAKDERGLVRFEHNGPLDALFTLGTIEAAFVTGAYMADISRGYRDLHRLREQMLATGDFARAVNAYGRYRRRQVSTYQVHVRKYGRHEYSRRDIRLGLMRAVGELYPEWHGVQQDPDVEIWVNVLGSTILVGLRLPPPSGWRPGDGAAGELPAAVAAAMALLATANGEDIFLDPDCGRGGIVGARSSRPARLILGGAAGAADVAAAHEAVGVRAAIVRWQPDALPLAPAAVTIVATHFPDTQGPELAAIHTQRLAELVRVLRPGAQAVILTRAYTLFKEALRAYPKLEIRSGYSLTLEGRWGRIYLVERLP